MGIFRSLTYVIAVDESYQMRTAEFVKWGGKAASFQLGGQNVDIYWVVIALLVITLLGQLLLKKTRLGTNLYAVGSNPKAAQLSGINTENTRIMAFVITGLLAAVGGVFQTARLQSTQVLLADSFNFDPIAAAVIGGCALDGGEGDCIGTLLGAIFMAALNSGIMKLGLSSAWQNVIKGIIIILVVLFDAWYRRFMSTRAMKRKAQQSGTEVA
ncbi:MAG: ABC transporter permease [Clostridiales bacterium]|nr:ABC transporter permease [Clostridiales bacterium]MDY5515396.1 ABC transporter permease [Candidatus Ventricola sp.]